MKKKNLIIAIGCIMTIAVTLYLFFAEYSVEEITPENYTKLQQNTTETIFQFGTTNYIYNDFFLSQAHDIVGPKNKVRKIGRFKFDYSNNSSPIIEVSDAVTNLGYTLNYKNSIPYAYSVYDYSMDRDKINIKECLKKIIEKNEFTIKTSTTRSFDLLIQETKEKFIVYTVQGHLENPFAIWVQLYYKKKYIKF